MKRKLFLKAGLLSSSLLLGFNAFAGGLSSAEIDKLVERSMAKYQVPGMAVGVIKDGKIVHLKGYGVRELGKPEKVDSDTLFAIGSNSKAFTTAAIALLVDEGKLNWDDKVFEYIPEFQLFDPWVTREFTIRDLVVHRSGLGLGAGDLMFIPEEAFSREEIIRNLRYLKPASSFRSEFAYDNLLYIVAGEIIPVVTGKSFEDFVDERILAPLGMDSCAANTVKRLKRAKNVAVPHAVVDGELTQISPIKQHNEYSVLAAAGGLQCSAASMLKWMQMHLDGGRLPDGTQLLSADQQQEIATPQMNLGASKLLANILDSNFRSYGLGFFIEDMFGYKYVSHGGGLPGMISHVDMVPGLNLGVVTLTNQQASSSREAVYYSILSAYMDVEQKDWFKVMDEARAKRVASAEAVMEQATAVKAKGSAEPLLPLSAYVGTYQDPWFGKVVISEKEDKLYFSSDRQKKLSGYLTPFNGNTFTSYWEYRSMEADAYVQFETDFEGNVSGIKMKAISPLTDFSFDFHDLDFEKVDSE